jgi:hypothetical protein
MWKNLCASSIVTMQRAQDWEGDDLATCMLCWHGSGFLLRNLLSDPLMRSSLVEVHDIRHEKPVELLLMEDQEVIQTFSPHASQEAFTHGIGSRSSVRRSKGFDVARGCYSCEFQPEFAIIVPNQVSWSFSIRSRLSQLLRRPGIRRRSGHIHMNDLARRRVR